MLLKLTKSMPGFRYDPSKGKFRSYLKTVVLHAIFSKSSQKRGAAQVEDIAELTRAADEDSAVGELWEVEWRRYHMRQAMRTIAVEHNEKDRRAFQMYALDGKDARETAAALELSVDQVYQAKSQILKRLGQLIDQQVQDEG